MQPSKQQVALVTGASKGIGRGIALGLAEAGWSVMINYGGDQAGAEATAAAVRERGQECEIVQADVGDSAHVQRMFAAHLDRWGRLDLLVNNAGMQTWAPLLEMPEEDFDRTIRTNLKGTFLCTQAAGRIMQPARSGCIVNIGSGANRVPFPQLAGYCASKGGIQQLTVVSAVELGPLGIRVNCVAPGAIEIERTRLEAPDYADTWSRETPLRRVGQVQDVAQAVVYLASDAASFVSGQTLYVDGGLFAQGRWPYDIPA